MILLVSEYIGCLFVLWYFVSRFCFILIEYLLWKERVSCLVGVKTSGNGFLFLRRLVF